MRMRPTWRWFGPGDPVSLSDVRQTGAQGVVSALHHLPHGEVWPGEEIEKRKAEIRAAGLSWDVVESVTVHESIKTRTGNYRQWIDRYRQTLRNLAASGIRIVTYNFMPVNDWTRTNLDYPMPDGSKALYFNWFDLAMFDIYVLKRKGAAGNYGETVLREAEKRHRTASPTQLERLTDIITFGIPGEKKRTLAQMRAKLEVYADIDHAALRENLTHFLREITPVADELGLKLAIHPDDPPFDILGLPRIVGRAEDFDYLLSAVPNPSNGICFCTGSLGAGPQNDLVQLVRQIGRRIHFVHLRNVSRDADGNFVEADHLAGDVDMYAVMREILAVQQRVAEPIPFRPDHGHQMMDDLNKVTNPGYSCIGRMRGLSELRGLELGICRTEGW